jgi:glycerol-3-phosphate acyltransferase PlsY
MNVLLVVAAYLVGSIPFGFMIGKMHGIDIRKYGSSNIGTSNVARTLGKKAAIQTLLGDGLKGLLMVLLARVLLESEGWLVAVALASIIGHNWSVYLKGKGGKGVTTTYGAYLGLAWLPALATILTWLAITKATNKSSIAALISAVGAPIFALLFGVSTPVLLFAMISFAMIYVRHIDNIRRILAGEENTLSQTIDIEHDEKEEEQG